MSNILVASLVLFNYFPPHTGSVQEFTVPRSGTFKVQCWGASGGDDTGNSVIGYGGLGGYTCGYLKINNGMLLYVCIGKKGSGNDQNVYFNGGGITAGAASGGGSTDIRLIYTNWNNFTSLKSRIMVAGGGGGGEDHYKNGGAGGGLSGYSSKSGILLGGTQNSGFAFGVALYKLYIYSATNNNDGWGGGGNGYYSGFSATAQTSNVNIDGGGGGSSFISGYIGCNAIAESSTESNIVHTGQPNHYSGYVFTNSVMIDGGSSMPSPTGGTETGHTGNGYCLITQISF